MRISMPPPAWLRAVCFAAFLAALVQIFLFDPPPPLVRLYLWDKVKHAIAYGGVAALLWFAIGFQAPWLNGIVITAIGALDELHQSYIPTRTADPVDVVADALGAAVVTVLLHRLARRTSGHTKKTSPPRGSRRALWTEQ